MPVVGGSMFGVIECAVLARWVEQIPFDVVAQLVGMARIVHLTKSMQFAETSQSARLVG
jgi:hypothetical protein